MADERDSAKNILCVECSPAQWVTERHAHDQHAKKQKNTDGILTGVEENRKIALLHDPSLGVTSVNAAEKRE